MLGVVSLLDEETSSFVRSLWEDLRREFGFSGMAADSSPHLSFHVAEHYDMAKVEAQVKSIARSTPPFASKTTGIGVFHGAEDVVFLPVVRRPRLTVVQRVIHDELKQHSDGALDFYAPDAWMPHVTLGRWDAAKAVVGDVVRFLTSRDLDRELPLDNFAMLEDGGETRRVHFVHRLTP